VANDLTVRLADSPRDDSDIATAIAHILENSLPLMAAASVREWTERNIMACLSVHSRRALAV
jgi:hypothetical protein